jgi:ferredoxin
VNLLALIEQAADMTARSTGVTLDGDRCLHKRDRLSECEACFGLCPTDAITPGQPPAFNQEACINCRACLPVCPVQAYQAVDETIPLLKQALRLAGKRLELICAPHPEPATGPPRAHAALMTRGCLAGLGKGTYLTLLALGLDEIILRTDGCAGCPLGSLQEQIERQATAVHNLRTAWPQTGRIHTTGPLESSSLVGRPVRPAGTPPLSRRELFGLKEAERHPSPPWLQGEDASWPANDHRFITAALAALGPPVENPILDGLGLAGVTVDGDKCSACGVCARACPTGTLHFATDDQGGFRLSAAPLNCIGCDLCTHVCMPDAISVNHSPTWEQLFGGGSSTTLLTGRLSACERCNSSFLARDGQRYCAICEFRRQNPFASVMPPGFERQLENSA